MRIRTTALCVGTAAAALCFAMGSSVPAFAQEASARSEQTEAQLAAGTAILAELTAGLDSKKLKAGDKVTAHTTEALKSGDGRTIIPRGAKLEGHVTQASARSKGESGSTLGIQFDKAILKEDVEISLNVAIRAMAPRDYSGPPPGEAGPTSIGTNQTSPMAGAHAPVPNASPQTGDTGGPAGNFPAAGEPRLNAHSQGAVGMKGITLDGAVVDGRPATVVSSNGKSVKLEEGTRILLVAEEKKGAA